jgi:hypothetical protein
MHPASISVEAYFLARRLRKSGWTRTFDEAAAGELMRLGLAAFSCGRLAPTAAGRAFRRILRAR